MIGSLRCFALLLLSALSLVACSEPAELLATHFEKMAALAETECGCKEKDKDTLLSGSALTGYLKAHPETCAKIGASLLDYLKTNKADMRDLGAKKAESEDATAQRIYTAARRLDVLTEVCGFDENIATFKHDLSKLVRESTGVGASQ